MIVVNLFYFSSIHRFFVYLRFPRIYDALAPWEKKRIERLVLFFVRFKFYCFSL